MGGRHSSPSEELIGRDEAAEILGMHRRNLARFEQKGKLHPVRIGRVKWYDRAAVVRLAAERLAERRSKKKQRKSRTKVRVRPRARARSTSAPPQPLPSVPAPQEGVPAPQEEEDDWTYVPPKEGPDLFRVSDDRYEPELRGRGRDGSSPSGSDAERRVRPMRRDPSPQGARREPLPSVLHASPPAPPPRRRTRPDSWFDPSFKTLDEQEEEEAAQRAADEDPDLDDDE